MSELESSGPPPARDARRPGDGGARLHDPLPAAPEQLRTIHNRFGPDGLWAAVRDESSRTIRAHLGQPELGIDDLFGPARQSLETDLGAAVAEALMAAGFEMTLFGLGDLDLGRTGEVIQATVRARHDLEREEAEAGARLARARIDAELSRTTRARRRTPRCATARSTFGASSPRRSPISSPPPGLDQPAGHRCRQPHLHLHLDPHMYPPSLRPRPPSPPRREPRFGGQGRRPESVRRPRHRGAGRPVARHRHDRIRVVRVSGDTLEQRGGGPGSERPRRRRWKAPDCSAWRPRPCPTTPTWSPSTHKPSSQRTTH